MGDFFINLITVLWLVLWIGGYVFVGFSDDPDNIDIHHPFLVCFIWSIVMILVGAVLDRVLPKTREGRLMDEERERLQEQFQGSEGQKLREQIRQEEIRRREQEQLAKQQKQQAKERGIREQARKMFFDQIRAEERRKLDNE